MITSTIAEQQESSDEGLAIRLYDILHTKDIKRQTTLQWPVANKLGIHQALLLEVVHNWTEYNAHKGALSYFYEECWWTSDTYEHWFASYPAFGSVRTLQRLFKELEESDYIISCRPFGRGKNGTKYYRVNKTKVGMLLLQDSPFCHVQYPESRQIGNSNLPKWQEEPAKVASSSIYINNINKEDKKELGNFTAQSTEQISTELLDADAHPIKQMEQKFKHGANEAYVKEQLAIIWTTEKPANFVDLPGEKIDHRSWEVFRRNYLNIYGEKESLTMFRESLIYAREYDDRKSRDKFSWRGSNMRLTFGRWVEPSKTEKIYDLSCQHKHSMKHDKAYADRVEGRAYGNEVTDYVDVSLDERDKAAQMLDYAKGMNDIAERMAKASAASDLVRERREQEQKLGETHVR